MATITDIAPQKKNGEFYNIFADGEFVCGLSALQLSNLGLRVGQELADVELSDIAKQATASKAHNAALRYLSFRPRSVYEVDTYLAGKEYDIGVIQTVSEKLQAAGLLNDTEFARAWVASRQLTKPRSQRVLALELSKKHIAKDIVEQVLSEEELGVEQVNLRTIAKKKLRLARFKQNKQKLIQYLLGQGFGYGDIKNVLDDLADKDYES